MTSYLSLVERSSEVHYRKNVPFEVLYCVLRIESPFNREVHFTKSTQGVGDQTFTTLTQCSTVADFTFIAGLLVIFVGIKEIQFTDYMN